MKTMKHIDLSSAGISPNSSWQILEELELPLDSDGAGVINTWLKEILNPLRLHTDLINRILKSAQDAVARARASIGSEIENGHIHLLVLVPRDHKTDAKTWGFFRIEKLASIGRDRNPLDHSIEFYLYIEGQ